MFSHADATCQADLSFTHNLRPFIDLILSLINELSHPLRDEIRTGGGVHHVDLLHGLCFLTFVSWDEGACVQLDVQWFFVQVDAHVWNRIWQVLSLHISLHQPLAMRIEGDARLDLLLGRLLQMDV